MRTIILMFCGVLVQAGAIAAENQNYASLMRQARAEYHAGHISASEALIVAALGTLQRTAERERAEGLAQLGDVYVSKDAVSNADRAYSESLAIYKRLSDKTCTVLLLSNLGGTYSLEGREGDALRVLRQALELTKAIPGADGLLAPRVLNGIGMVYYRQGKNGKAETTFNQALKMLSPSKVPPDTTELMNNLGVVYIANHKFEKAEDVLRQALKIEEAEFGQSHPDLTYTLYALAFLNTQIGRYTDAVDQYRRALKILEESDHDFDTRIARTLHALAATYTKTGQNDDAAATLAEAAVIARRNLNQHFDMAAILEDYAAILRNQGRAKEAEELGSEVKRARVTSSLVISAHNP